jgi:eukaryotic-like serine/threonine-protein kinase
MSQKPMQLAPGMMVNANVRLVELLGEGGMGSVWLADHLGLEARVAVKFIAPTLVNLDPSLRDRFRREASICARLRSIHVVQSFDHGSMEDGTPYIVMELLEGEGMTNRVERDGPFALREVAIIVSQVAKVLHRAHVLGIVHRDIKPDNIFLIDSDYELFCKVLDFGIAKQTASVRKDGAITKTGVIVGTPEFMSPEQAISSKNIDYRSDLYSLGVVAYYALTAKLPFDTGAQEPLWLQMARRGHMPPSTHRKDIPADVDGFFARALQPQPADRFQSARLMAEALLQIVDPRAVGQLDDLSISEDRMPFPAQETSGVLPTPAVDQGGIATPVIPDSESHPAKYELLGPDSADVFHGESTVVMDREDHSDAESGEGALTQRQPERHVPMAYAPTVIPEDSGIRGIPPTGGWAAPPAAVAAVHAGAYNSGEPLAYNAMVPAATQGQAFAPWANPNAAELRGRANTDGSFHIDRRRRSARIAALAIGAVGVVLLAAVLILLLRLG